MIIGKKHFESPLIQAPLAGISCAPFRELIWEFGGAAYACTEMLSALSVVNHCDRSPRYHTRSSKEKILCWQLSGNQPDILARASITAINQKADLLDLNCGCPQPKIRKKGCGSQLLRDEKKLAELIRVMKQDPSVPVTLKIRIDANYGEQDDCALAQMAQEAGADAIIVHGRHWTHDYTVPAQLDAIARVAESVCIPVIANGDVTDAQSLKTMLEKTQCAGVMIARASVGQPWLFRQLTDPDFKPPSPLEAMQLFLQHAKGLITLEGEKHAMLQCRKLGKYYARGMNEVARKNFVTTLQKVERWREFVEAMPKL